MDQAPASWAELDCRLMPSTLYVQEEANMKIAWCQEDESNCDNLPPGKNGLQRLFLKTCRDFFFFIKAMATSLVSPAE